MPSTLTCPHCGSTLNFGMEVAPGTAVDCLICMQSFVAEPTLALEETVLVERPKPAHRLAIQVAKPYGAAPVAPPAAPPLRRPRETKQRTKLGQHAILVGLLLLVASAGVAFSIWKIASMRSGPSAEVSPQAASPGNVNSQAAVPPKVLDAPGEEGILDDEDARKIKEAEKNLLTRKNSPQAGVKEFEWDQVASFNAADPGAPTAEQKAINRAIEKGVTYLKQNQNANGAWSFNHPVGHASIGGLTLLESQVPATDSAVQRAAACVRAQIANLDYTYEISLAILFLDRLGDPRDRVLIQGLALRLVAGQNDGGGWTYHCPILPAGDMYQLFAFLQAHKKPMQNALKANPKLASPLKANANKLNDPFQQFGELVLLNGLADTKTPSTNPKQPASGAKPSTPAPMPQPPRLDLLKPPLQNLPIVRDQGKGKGKGKQLARSGGGDNSNTQFALLALWAARRHDVPTDQAILAAYHRFATSQHTDGGWGYTPPGRTTNTMTCVGLLGLAMGHGAAPEFIGVDPKNPKQALVKPALADPKIKTGLKTLARSIGQPDLSGTKTTFPMENLYLLWSIERVAMLYDLHTIDGKDWYRWGAQILVHNQRPEGDWTDSRYHGASPPLNTCFALLFLRRSNLVQDLTNNLRLYTAIRDPEK